MQTPQQSTNVLATAQQAESLGTNILTLLQKGYNIADIFNTAGEYLAEEESPTLSSANAYLLNWARHDGSWAIDLT